MQVHSLQIQQAGLILSSARENSLANHISFLRDNYGFKKIRDRLAEPNFKLALGLAFAEICAYAGIKFEISEPDKKDIHRMILMVYSDLTLEEIYKAFELERYGLYGVKTEHYQQFNADYVSNVLQKFKKWRQEARMQHNISADQKSEPKVELSEQEKRDLMDKAIIRSFDEYLANSEISIPCGHIFDELYERKMFPENTDYQKKYQIAKFQIEKELKSEKSPHRQERLKIKEAIESLGNTNNEKVLARAKMLVLKEYFDSLKEINAHVKEFINQIP